MSSTGTYKWNIDWLLDGYSTADDMTADVRSEWATRLERGRDQARQISPPMAGRGDYELDNADRHYSRDNSTGPYYGYLLPNRPTKIEVDWNSTTYPLWAGHLTEITPHVSVGARTVTMSALGPLAQLKAQAEGNKISTPLYQFIRTDQALGYILDAIGWPAGDRNLDTGQTTLGWWWLDEEDAFEAAKQLVATEGPGAALYEDAEGNIVFEGRHYRITTARCTASQATFSSTGEPYLSEPFEYEEGIRDIVNLCTVEQKIRTAESTASEVWSLGGSLTLGSNETRKVIANASNPFAGALTPSTSGSDYTITAGSLSTVSLNRTNGQNCTISLTAGAAGATLTGLRLRAQSVPVTATNLLSNTISSTGSQDNYGIRVYPLPVRAEVKVDTLQDFVNAVVSLYKEPRPRLAFTVVGQSSESLTQVYTREVSDRVTVIESQIGTTGDFHVERIEHLIEHGGGWHLAKFGCEAVWTAGFFILDSTTHGILDTNVLGY